MKTSLPHMPDRFAGFTLPTILVMSAGMLVLLSALMTIVSLERTTSDVSSEGYRAELAVESGLEEAKAVLAMIGSSDSFVIAEQQMGVAFDDNGDGVIDSFEDDTLEADEHGHERGRPYLYGLQGKVTEGGVSYQVIPLFTTGVIPETQLLADGTLELPEEPGLSTQTELGLEATTVVQAVKAKQAPVTNWRIVRNFDGDAVAQYSYWVEDMQGQIDPSLVPGNSNGRANERWPDLSDWNEAFVELASSYQENESEVPLWPAPGINPGYSSDNELSANNSLLDQVALFSLKTDGVEAGESLPVGGADNTDFDDRIREVADLALTPATLAALYGVEDATERVASGEERGRLVDEDARLIEENLTRGNRSWEEQALVPFVAGLSPDVMGEKKLNLNALLADERGGAINEMVDFIATALPNFANERQGGFTEDYLATLAANALDYADEDGDPSVEESVYRGIENTPLVSEFLRTTTFEWQVVSDQEDNALSAMVLNNTSNPFVNIGGRKHIAMTVRVYAEFWNQSNHLAEGEYRLSYENFRTITEGFLPEISFAEESLLANNLSDEGALSVGNSGSYHELEKLEDGRWYFPAKALRLESNGYLLEYVGAVRYLFDVGPESYFASDTIDLLDGSEQSSYSLRWKSGDDEFRLVDRARGGVEVSEISSTLVESKNSRTFSHVCANSYRELFGEFANGMGDLRMSYYANIPQADSQYPGNYSPNRRNVRYSSIYSQDENTLWGRTLPSEWPDGGHDSSADWRNFNHTTDRSFFPDAPRFSKERAPVEPEKAPVFLSNLGRFISETELGRVFDPIMWEDGSFAWVAEVTASNASESDKVGGGNTLRIGRPEHPRFFEIPGNGGRADTSLSAFRLLDLFHCGMPMSSDESLLRGENREVAGHININTAPREVLRALAAGKLVADTEISTQSNTHDTNRALAPRTNSRELGALFNEVEADVIADRIIAGRPYLSPSDLAAITAETTASSKEQLFGNPSFISDSGNLQWNDQAAEEVFARVYNSSTVRSRNFRVHVVGQSLKRTSSGRYLVGSTKRKSYRVFVDRGETSSGEIEPSKVTVEVINEVNH